MRRLQSVQNAAARLITVQRQGVLLGVLTPRRLVIFYLKCAAYNPLTVCSCNVFCQLYTAWLYVVGGKSKSKGINEHAKHKPRLNMQKNTRSNRAVWTAGSCAHGKLAMYIVQPKCQDHFNCSPLLFSWPAPLNRCGQTEKGLHIAPVEEIVRVCFFHWVCLCRFCVYLGPTHIFRTSVAR